MECQKGSNLDALRKMAISLHKETMSAIDNEDSVIIAGSVFTNDIPIKSYRLVFCDGMQTIYFLSLTIAETCLEHDLPLEEVINSIQAGADFIIQRRQEERHKEQEQ